MIEAHRQTTAFRALIKNDHVALSGGSPHSKRLASITRRGDHMPPSRECVINYQNLTAQSLGGEKILSDTTPSGLRQNIKKWIGIIWGFNVATRRKLLSPGIPGNNPGQGAGLIRLTVIVLLLAGCEQNGSANGFTGSPNMQGMVASTSSMFSGAADALLSRGNPALRQAVNSAGGTRTLGATFGRQIGTMLSQSDQKALQAKTQQALTSQRDGATVDWASVDTSASGTVTPTRTRTEMRPVPVSQGSSTQGQVVTKPVTCRDVTTTVTSGDGKPASGTETACKMPNGTWQLD